MLYLGSINSEEDSEYEKIEVRDSDDIF